jgi:hypothetical protein
VVRVQPWSEVWGEEAVPVADEPLEGEVERWRERGRALVVPVVAAAVCVGLVAWVSWLAVTVALHLAGS